MPPKLKAPAASKTPAPPATPLESITGRMDKLRVKEAESFSFNQKVPTMTKEYCKNNKDKVELEFISLPLEREFFEIGLSEDGMDATVKIATPGLMGEEKRMKTQMGAQCKKNDPRAIAHSNVVQKVREESKAKNGKHWGDPQSVRLPAKCEWPPTKKWTLLPFGSVVVPGPNAGAPGIRHTQFVLVTSIFFNVAKKRVRKEKAGSVTVCAALSADSEDSDVDENDDDESEGDGMDDE